MRDGIWQPNPIFAQQKFDMAHQHEYQEELQKIQDKDFTHNWVSSSAFLFYLSVFCIVALLFGSCYKLYAERYDRLEVIVPKSTQYAPTYQ